MLVAYDGSAAAQRALAHAGDFAGPADRVTVVNVMPEPSIGAGIGRPGAQRNRQWQLLDEARRLMARRGIETDSAARVGEPATEVLAAADEVGADVIVVGRRRGKTAHVLGSISGRIVRDASCDVLVVHAEDKPSTR